MGPRAQCERSTQALITSKEAGLSFGGDRSFNFLEEKMLSLGEFNLNSLQGYANSLKEVLKQTMLNQEVIFRKQVNELHRVYRIQKTLMEDSGWKEVDGYNLWKVGSTQSVNKDFLEENHSDCSRLQQRLFDLQLPADQHANHLSKDLLQKGNGWDLREPIELKLRFHDDYVSSQEGVELTLSIGGDTRKKGSGKRTWYDKIPHSSSHHVIDLEESTDMVSNEDAKSVSILSCAALISGDKHDLRVPEQANGVSRNSEKKDLSHGLTVSYSHGDGSENCEEQNSFNQGFKERHHDLACNDMFANGRPFTSYEAVGLDLNRVQLDDSSYLNDQVVACLSTASSSGAFDRVMGKFYEGTCPTATSWRTPNFNCSSVPSTCFRQDDAANPNLLDPDSSNSSSKFWAISSTFKGTSRIEACPIDLESVSGPLSDIHENLDNDCKNSGSGNIEFSLKFQNENHTDLTTAEVIEMSEEDIAFSHPCRNGNRIEDVNSDESPTSCKFDCIADDSSSGGKTMQCGTGLGEPNISTANQFQLSLSSQVAETQSGEQDLRSSDSSELKHQCGNKKEEESAGDVLIQKAAESLIHFSLGSSASNQDCCTKAGSNESENEGRDQPQYSLDSYESIVLKLKESSVDDYCVSSKPFEVNELDKKDCGIKLKRGRRHKDFQRDILPGLASLTRHEILEDINIMEAVIRSREYKRMRSKMAGGGNWFAPVKSRRSRLNYVGRRYYS